MSDLHNPPTMPSEYLEHTNITVRNVDAAQQFFLGSGIHPPLIKQPQGLSPNASLLDRHRLL